MNKRVQNEGMASKKVNEKESNKISSDSTENNKNESRKIIPDYIDNLESIINFSKEKNKVFINFTNDFWKYILNCYNEITTNNIKICSKLREIFIIYYKLVDNDDTLKDSKLRKEVSEYHKND